LPWLDWKSSTPKREIVRLVTSMPSAFEWVNGKKLSTGMTLFKCAEVAYVRCFLQSFQLSDPYAFARWEFDIGEVFKQFGVIANFIQFSDFGRARGFFALPIPENKVIHRV